ncbi:MAG: N-acyl-D-amino-acid deacylase family protein [Cetobacterium sp.]
MNISSTNNSEIIFDLVIENGTIIFGYNRPSQILNIGILKDKIYTFSKETLRGKKIIDAKNLYVCPGFIDIHSHSDISGFSNKNCLSKLYQGVTTEVNGNCGIGIFPTTQENRTNLAKYIQTHSDINYHSIPLEKINTFYDLKTELNRYKLNTNQGYLVGAGCLRIAIMGFKSRIATDEEIYKMTSLLEKQFEEGALGISFGLVYQPGNFMSKKEIIEILKIVKKYDKVASFHMRDESDKIIESIEEIIFYSKMSGAKVNISHLKVMNKKNWGKAEEILKSLETAKNMGVNISFDQYPYNATCTNLFVLLPQNIFSGDINLFIKDIPTLSETILKEIKENINKRGGGKNISISNFCTNLFNFNGFSLYEVSKILNLSEEESVLYLIKNSVGSVQAIYFSLDMKDVKTFLKSDYGVIASDGNSFPMTDSFNLGTPHPRSFGTFPRYIDILKNELPIEKIINRITSKPAKIFRISNRGEIRKNYFADITIFNLDKIKDNSTFENPFLKPSGIKHVIVNGKIIVYNNSALDSKNGYII